MDLPLAREALAFARRRRRWLLLLAAVGTTGYGAYRVYHLPAVAEKRRKVGRLLRALVAMAAAFSASAETVGILSDDLNRFLRGDSEEIPPSFNQLSKVAASEEFAACVARVSEALTAGVLRGAAAAAATTESKPESSVPDRLLEKLFSSAGSGFASAVVGSFARNLVMGFYAAQGESPSAGSSTAPLDSEVAPVPAWVHLVCDDKVRQLIGDCVQVFVGTAVAVYLDKTMDLNMFDEMFIGLANPKHEAKMKDVLVSLCNGAMETLVRTSHKVLTCPPPCSTLSTDREEEGVEVEEEPPAKRLGVEDGGGRWVDAVSTTLAVPSNRSFVLDVTGRVTSETVRSFLDFVLGNVLGCAKKSVGVVRGEVAERGREVVRYATARFMVVLAVCLALCLHLLPGTRVMFPANPFSSAKESFLS